MKGAELIFHYLPDLTDLQKKQFEDLEKLYADWNEKINVISRKDMEFFFERHVLHSLGIAKIIQFKKNTRVLDVGTGGGFPGIPLSILFPETNFFLVDSIGKKIKVVNEVIKELSLKNVKAEQIRAEEIKSDFDFIVSRAVTEFPKFYQWVHKKISKTHFNSLKNGILYLKGGDLNEELKDFKNSAELFHLNQFFEEPFFETKKVVYLPIIR